MPKARRRLPADTDLLERLLKLKPEKRERALRLLGDEEADSFDASWPTWAHRGQRPPEGDWRVWVCMAGRGFGETRAGAQWVAEAIGAGGDISVALVAATIEEGRSVMVEGRSGLLKVAEPHVDHWNPTRGVLRFKSGAKATPFAGCSPEKLRGPEHHLAWCDELAKWERAGETWDMLQLGLRLGERPRALVTTTPRPGPVLRRIMAEPGCATTGGRTAENPHVSRAFQNTVRRLYEGTRLAAQELDGVLLPEGGALWTPEVLEGCRVGAVGVPPFPFVSDEVEKRASAPSAGPFLDDARNERVGGDGPPRGGAASPCATDRFVRTVVGVDPPSGDGTCGIVVCGLDGEGFGHVLADHSVTGRSPEGWARAVADAARVHGAGRVVAERNQGGRMVEAVLRAAEPTLDVALVNASDGKAARAEPVALLFEAGRVRLRGRFPDLEGELLNMVAGAPYQGRGSPDRADAMVWALTELMLGRAAAEPRIVLF